MSKLRVYRDKSPHHTLLETADPNEIVHALNKVGVRFEQWKTDKSISGGAGEEEVKAAYKEDIQRLVDEGGYRSMDVIHMHAEHPQRDELRQKFLSEHTHAEDEVRFFVAGSGQFTLHIDDCVYDILCCQGDLIGVPAGTRHWFDMSARPSFTAIRLFTNPDGWIANFTGDDIADRFPRMPAPESTGGSKE